MGLSNSPDTFQEKNVSVFKLRTNPTNEDSPTYDMKALTFSSGTVEEFIMWKRDLLKICVGQHVSDAAGLKEYLGSWITRDEIQPISNKVEAIQNIAPL
jgi:hypothetical protein